MILMDDFHCVISFFLACIQVFTIIKGIYKCYEHFNHKTIKIFLWEGMDCKKSIWMTFHPFHNYKISTSKNHVTMGKSQ